MTSSPNNMFGVLLRYWRNVRGLSQIDLAAIADVSSRHLSFLETGRSQPSRDMVLRLAAALDVPLREQNALLRGRRFCRSVRPSPDSPRRSTRSCAARSNA